MTKASDVTELTSALVPEKQSLVRKVALRFSVDDDKLLHCLKSTVFRQSGDEQCTDAQMLMMLAVVDQYGLNPFTREVFAFPDKTKGIVPIVSVDGWSRICNEHEQMDGLKFTQSEDLITNLGARDCPAWIECVIYRKDRAHPTQIKEFLDECYRPPFKVKGKPNRAAYEVAGPWQSHTKRMLRHKALIQCARIAFGYAGIYDHDEGHAILAGESSREIIDVELIEHEPAKSRTDSAKDTLKKKAQTDQAKRQPGDAATPAEEETLSEVNAEIQDDKRKPDPDFPLPEDYGGKTQEITDANKGDKK